MKNLTSAIIHRREPCPRCDRGTSLAEAHPRRLEGVRVEIGVIPDSGPFGPVFACRSCGAPIRAYVDFASDEPFVWKIEEKSR